MDWIKTNKVASDTYTVYTDLVRLTWLNKQLLSILYV